MSKAKTKTFQSGNSEAVRLPKGLGFGLGVEIEIERQGEVVTLRPVRPEQMPWDEFWRWYDSLGPRQKWTREPVEIPDRGPWTRVDTDQ